MADQSRAQEMIDRSEILNVVAKSILTRDSGLWDEHAECYHSQAEITSSWWQGKPSDFARVAGEDLDAVNAQGGAQKHFASNHWIELNADRAVCECDLILYLRRPIEGVMLDFATWSRRINLMARENGDWKVWRWFAVYERDRMDPVDPSVSADAYHDAEALAAYPGQIRHHLWRNALTGLRATKALCIRGTDQERAVRAEARDWIEGVAAAQPA